MKRPLFLSAAVLVLSVAGRRPVGWAALPPSPATSPPKLLNQIRGFSMQLTNSSPEWAQKYEDAIDDLADMGCTWINLVVAAQMDNVHSESISIPWADIPSQKTIEKLLHKAKDRKMSVMMMPIVLLKNAGSKDWRGVIAPPDWDNWFASYNAYITYMAKLANANDVDVFCVGSELLSTEEKRDNWLDTIGQIKQVFPGKLTYSANWDHYTVPTFWDKLDYIGMNNYNELASKPGVPVKELDKTWEPIKKDILDFAAKQKKPFMFTEVGWHNLQNTIKEPWNYVDQSAPIDFSEQEHAYQSFVDTWGKIGNDQFMGAFVWEWSPGADPKVQHTYSLQGTPAMEIVRKWMITR